MLTFKQSVLTIPYNVPYTSLCVLDNVPSALEGLVALLKLSVRDSDLPSLQ